MDSQNIVHTVDDQTIERYLEIKDILKSNKEEMKPLRKELKELEQEILESGAKEISHYGVIIKIEPVDKEKLNKEKAEELIGQAIHSGNGKFEDYYDVTTQNKIKVEDMTFDNNKKKKSDN